MITSPNQAGPKPSSMHQTFPVVKWRDGSAAVTRDDALAAEQPLEIRVRGKAVSVTMRTPGGAPQDAELAAGFLLSEGLIQDHTDIVRIAACARARDGDVINVFLRPGITLDRAQLQRHTFMSSSCGVCGKACIESVRQHFEPILDAPRIEPQTLLKLPDRMRLAQHTFDRTGGLHAAGLFDERGQLLVVREDIGRHNAVDKVLGHAWLNGWLPLDQHVLLVSGRVSFEIVQKALAGRIPYLAAVSAPSSLAVEFAQDNGQTLIGFLRDGRMNLYSHSMRVVV